MTEMLALPLVLLKRPHARSYLDSMRSPGLARDGGLHARAPSPIPGLSPLVILLEIADRHFENPSQQCRKRSQHLYRYTSPRVPMHIQNLPPGLRGIRNLFTLWFGWWRMPYLADGCLARVTKAGILTTLVAFPCRNCER